VAIEKENHSFADVLHVKDLGKTFLEELEDFFVNYHELSGEKYRILGAKGPAAAMKRVKDGIRAFEEE
jgi:inorganic pyrophosphatase